MWKKPCRFLFPFFAKKQQVLGKENITATAGLITAVAGIGNDRILQTLDREMRTKPGWE